MQHAGELPGKIPHHLRANGLTGLGAKARRRFPVLSNTGYEPNEVEWDIVNLLSSRLCLT